MPTSAPGNSFYADAIAQATASATAIVDAPSDARYARGIGRRHGFTLLELLVVLAIVALSVALVSLALRDPDASRLETEAERLAVLLEQARVEARVMGVPVSWAPVSPERPGIGGSNVESDGPAPQFRFTGLPPSQRMPTRWLESATRAQIVGGDSVVLGPQAILPAQRIVLSLGDRKLELASDGLSAFAAVP